MTKDQWTIKTLEEEAVNSDSPEATKEKGIQEHTVITEVAYIFALICGNISTKESVLCFFMLLANVAKKDKFEIL